MIGVTESAKKDDDFFKLHRPQFLSKSLFKQNVFYDINLLIIVSKKNIVIYG